MGLKGADGLPLEGDAIFTAIETQINVADVKTFIGLLIGGSIAFLFSALAIALADRLMMPARPTHN